MKRRRKKPGRPKGTGQYDLTLQVRLSQGTADRLDAYRGDTSRSDCVRAILDASLPPGATASQSEPPSPADAR